MTASGVKKPVPNKRTGSCFEPQIRLTVSHPVQGSYSVNGFELKDSRTARRAAFFTLSVDVQDSSVTCPRRR